MVDREPSMADADIAAENGDENSRLWINMIRFAAAVIGNVCTVDIVAASARCLESLVRLLKCL